jgi:SAM-dependent methyltransferase
LQSTNHFIVRTLTMVLKKILVILQKGLHLFVKPLPTQNELICKFIDTLYAGIIPELVSKQARETLTLDKDDYIYGEIYPAAFLDILSESGPQAGTLFVDLGSGSGKAALTAALRYPFAKVMGIELLPQLHQLSTNLLTLANKNSNQSLASVEFQCRDFLTVDFSDADLIFINATCLNYVTWETLQARFKCLKPGSRIITTSKKLDSSYVDLVYSGMHKMGWGMNSVMIYQKK